MHLRRCCFFNSIKDVNYLSLYSSRLLLVCKNVKTRVRPITWIVSYIVFGNEGSYYLYQVQV